MRWGAGSRNLGPILKLKKLFSVGNGGEVDDDEDDDEPMMLEPQTEMTVEGEEEDDEDDGGSTGDDIALPPSVTLRPAGGPPMLAVRSNIL